MYKDKQISSQRTASRRIETSPVRKPKEVMLLGLARKSRASGCKTLASQAKDEANRNCSSAAGLDVGSIDIAYL